MNNVLNLFLTFARIGLFIFDGAYAMIFLIEDSCGRQVVGRGQFYVSFYPGKQETKNRPLSLCMCLSVRNQFVMREYWNGVIYPKKKKDIIKESEAQRQTRGYRY